MTHYIGGTLETLRADLKAFISGNTKWIHDTCSDLLQLRKQKVEDFCNAIIEPGYQFDELAITVVCKMKIIHCLVLLENSYWTTRSKFDYQGCLVKLCYLGGGIYKELAPKYTGEPVKSVTFGSKKKNFTIADPPKSSVVDPLSSDLNVGCLSDHDEVQQPPNDTQCNETNIPGFEDLHNTGIIPENAVDSGEPPVQNRDGPTTDILEEAPPVEIRDGPGAEPPVQNQDVPSSIEDHESTHDVSSRTKKIQKTLTYTKTDQRTKLMPHRMK